MPTPDKGQVLLEFQLCYSLVNNTTKLRTFGSEDSEPLRINGLCKVHNFQKGGYRCYRIFVCQTERF